MASQPDSGPVACPICGDLIDWASVELVQFHDAERTWVPLDLSGIHNKAKLADIKNRAYVRCPNPSADHSPHVLPYKYGLYGRPIVITLVGRPASGKTSLMAGLVHSLLSGALSPYKVSVTPLDHVALPSARDMWDQLSTHGLFPPGTTNEGIFAGAYLLHHTGSRGRVIALREADATQVGRLSKPIVADAVLVLEGADAIRDPRTSESLAQWATYWAGQYGVQTPCAVALTKADLLRHIPAASKWLTDPKPAGMPLADRVISESHDVYHLARKANMQWLCTFFDTTDLCTLHFVSVFDPIRNTLGHDSRLLEPLFSLLCMTGVLQSDHVEAIRSRRHEVVDIRLGDDDPLPNPRAPLHAGVLNDAASVHDRLGMAEDVNSMAMLLAAKSTSPPLSIALLGDWGTGKSSFMAQVVERVARLAEASTMAPRGSAYVCQVRQVRFNAWHYSDDHLWTGLIEHLFRGLSASPIAAPAPGRKEALDAELKTEQHNKDVLTGQLDRIEQVELGGWLGGLNQPFRAQRVLRAAGRSIWREARRTKAGWLGLALLIAGGGLTVYFGQSIAGALSGLVAAVVGLTTPILAVGQRIGRVVDEQQEKLVRERDASAKRVGKLRAKLALEDPAIRLDDLLAEVTAADRYEQFRGLTGRIHHDLDQLDQHLASAVRNWEASTSSESPPLQRIILYIDDLDRCRSERVVEVLQAISLLLSLRLFAVVVAVDPPWLLQALEDHYGPRLLAADSGRSRALDYLEKIFQLAYTVRPPGHEHTETYFRFLLPEVEVPDVGQASLRPDASPAAPSVRRQTEPASALQAPARSPETGSREYTRSGMELSARALYLTHAEHQFLPRLRVLLPTPRAMKRLANLYRLTRIDAHDRLDDFLGKDGVGPYQAAALLLVLVVTDSRNAAEVLLRLITSSGDGDVIGDDSPLRDTNLEVVRWIKENGPVHSDLATYREWAPIVARYGFETYHLAR